MEKNISGIGNDWTRDYQEFKEFIQKNGNDQVNKYYELITMNLSTFSHNYCNSELKKIDTAFKGSSSKKDFLLFHLKKNRIEPELLNTETPRGQKLRIKLGYVFGLNATDFRIWDFIDPDIKENPYKYLAILPNTDKMYERLYKDLFPLSLKNLHYFYDRYVVPFKEVAKGYSQYLLAIEIQKMLNNLENENLKEPEIENSYPAIKKLIWQGNKNQLYDVVRQLKKKDHISNSYTEIAGFICQNFEGFGSNYTTVLKEIQREQRPAKNKRIDLDLSELPGIGESSPK